MEAITKSLTAKYTDRDVKFLNSTARKLSYESLSNQLRTLFNLTSNEQIVGIVANSTGVKILVEPIFK